MLKTNHEIRLIFYFPVLLKTFELRFSTKVSLRDEEPYLSELLKDELKGKQILHEGTMYYLESENRFLDKNITVANLCLHDGLRILVF